MKTPWLVPCTASSWAVLVPSYHSDHTSLPQSWPWTSGHGGSRPKDRNSNCQLFLLWIKVTMYLETNNKNNLYFQHDCLFLQSLLPMCPNLTSVWTSVSIVANNSTSPYLIKPYSLEGKYYSTQTISEETEKLRLSFAGCNRQFEPG